MIERVNMKPKNQVSFGFGTKNKMEDPLSPRKAYSNTLGKNEEILNAERAKMAKTVPDEVAKKVDVQA